MVTSYYHQINSKLLIFFYYWFENLIECKYFFMNDYFLVFNLSVFIFVEPAYYHLCELGSFQNTYIHIQRSGPLWSN